jgi:hypothetical protein
MYDPGASSSRVASASQDSQHVYRVCHSARLLTHVTSPQTRYHYQGTEYHRRACRDGLVVCGPRNEQLSSRESVHHSQ